MIPPRIDITFPRGSHVPTLRKSIDVHVFACETFDLGREVLAVGDKLPSAFTRRSEHSSTLSGCLKNCRVYSRPCGARQTRHPRQLVTGLREPDRRRSTSSPVLRAVGQCIHHPVSGIAGTVSVP
jgi:hypothetical protein